MKNFYRILIGTKNIGMMTVLTTVFSMLALWFWQERPVIIAHGLFIATIGIAILTMAVVVYSLAKMYTQPSDAETLRAINEALQPRPIVLLRYLAIVSVGALMAVSCYNQYRIVALLLLGQIPTSIPMLVLVGLNTVSSIVTVGVSILYLIYLKDAETIVLEIMMQKYEKLKKMSGE